MSEEPFAASEVIHGLIDVGGILASRAPLDTRLDRLLGRMVDLLAIRRASILVADGGIFRVAYARPGGPEVDGRTSSGDRPADAPIMRRVFAAGTFLSLDVAADPATGRELDGIVANEAVGSVVLAPMSDPDGGPVGVLVAERSAGVRAFRRLEAEMIGGIALLVRGAILADRDRLRGLEAEDARRRLRERLVEAEDRERRRISHDIHDDVLQRVTSFAHYLEVAADQVVADDLLTRQLRWMHGEARDVAITLRRLVADLLPVDVVDRTLQSSLEGVVHAAARLSPVDIRLRVGRTEPTPEPVRAAVVRIARQAVDNALAHADASIIEVTVDAGGSATTLVVHDDGIGFDTDDHELRGIGTFSMMERAELLDGTCSVSSEPGRGTTVEVLIPHRSGF